jgi:hypothetical protein
VTTGDADGNGIRGVRRRDVLRRVAENEDARRIEGRAKDDTGAIDRLTRQLAAVSRVRAVAAEGEETVETSAGELDMGCCLDRSGRDPEQKSRSGRD